MAAAHPFGSFVGCRFKRIGIARLQETTSQCALTLCHAVLRLLLLRALVGPALRPPASQCAPGLSPGSLTRDTVHIYSIPQTLRFTCRPVYMAFMMDRVVLGQVFDCFDFSLPVLFYQCSTHVHLTLTLYGLSNCQCREMKYTSKMIKMSLKNLRTWNFIKSLITSKIYYAGARNLSYVCNWLFGRG